MRLRIERDGANRRVQELKRRRKELKADVAKKLGQVNLLNDSLDSLQRQISVDISSAQQKIKDLEWKVQTTSLDLEEESRIIDQVHYLESQLNLHKRLEVVKERITELRAETGALKIQTADCHEQILELAEESRKCYDQILELRKKLDEIKVAAAEAHRRYVEMKKEFDEFQSNYVDTMNRRYEEGVARGRIEKSAREKLKNKKRLSFEEFKILVEKGEV